MDGHASMSWIFLAEHSEQRGIPGRHDGGHFVRGFGQAEARAASGDRGSAECRAAKGTADA